MDKQTQIAAAQSFYHGPANPIGTPIQYRGKHGTYEGYITARGPVVNGQRYWHLHWTSGPYRAALGACLPASFLEPGNVSPESQVFGDLYRDICRKTASSRIAN